MADWIDYEDIVRYEKKNHLLGGVSHFIVGVYEGVKELAEKSKPSFVLRFYTEDKSNLFFDEANRKVKEERDYVKKSTTNFLGIEENIRKIAEKILLSSYPKRELYARISTKLG